MDTADYNETMPLTACWPLSKEGPLPKGLLGPEYLEKVFFRSGPIEWQCSASAVRKWLKALRRGAIEESNRSLHFQSAGAERDRDLAVYVCDNPRTRERIRDFPIEIEEGYSRFGRQRLRSRKVHHSSLSNLLWLGFRHDPSYNAIVEWTELIGISRPDIGDGDYYLTAEVIESALSNGSPHDFLIDTVEFARALILFAGLLPHDEAFELLLTASRLGCSPLEQLLFMGTDPMPKPNQADPVWTNDNSREQTQSVSLVLPPRLESTNQGAIDIATVVRASAEIDRMANNLIEAEKG